MVDIELLLYVSFIYDTYKLLYEKRCHCFDLSTEAVFF